jgi:SAM-dependent methyltransferase
MIRLIDSIISLSTWIKKNQKSKTNEDIIKINLGSGLEVTEGWINVDSSLNSFLSSYPKLFLIILYKMNNYVLKKVYNSQLNFSQDEFINILKNHKYIHHNLEYGIPFRDESVDYLYSSHFLEHLFKSDAINLINDAYRVLKKGGVMRLSVPDLDYVISLYHDGKKERALSYFYLDDNRSSYSFHRYMYDFDILSEIVSGAGFVNIKKCKFQEGIVPDIKKLDRMPEQTLFMEASKK